MNTTRLANFSNFSKLQEVCLSDRSNSPRNSHYGKLYHISECLRPLLSEILDRTDRSLNDQKGGRGDA